MPFSEIQKDFDERTFLPLTSTSSTQGFPAKPFEWGTRKMVFLTRRTRRIFSETKAYPTNLLWNYLGCFLSKFIT
jgi:hypothetical protein